MFTNWYWLNRCCCFGRQECGCLHTSKGRKWSTQKTGEHEPHPVAARYCKELGTLVHSSAHTGAKWAICTKIFPIFEKKSLFCKNIIASTTYLTYYLSNSLCSRKFLEESEQNLSFCYSVFILLTSHFPHHHEIPPKITFLKSFFYK